MMKNIGVRKKLIFACLAILLVFSASSVTSYILNNEVMQKYQYFYEYPYQDVNLVKKIQTEILSIRISIKDCILAGYSQNTGSIIQDVENGKALLDSDILQLRKSYLGNAHDIEDFQNQSNQWWALCLKVFDLLKANRIQDAADLSVTVASNYSRDMIDSLDRIIASANATAGEYYAKAAAAHSSSENSSLFFLSLSILVSVLIIIGLTRDITRPIKAMMSNIQKVEAGEAVRDIDTAGRGDELGKVTDAFNRMIGYLKTQKELYELKWTLEHQKTLEQFRITLMSIGDAVISADTQGRVLNLNPVAEKLTGWALDDARGRQVDDVFRIFNAKTQKKAENPLAKVLEQGVIVGLANHTILRSKSGEQYHIADSAAPIRDENGQLYGVVLVFRDVTESYRKQEEIISMSFHDKLTGLYNRAFFEEEITRLNAGRQMPLALIMADINGLKLINDTFGHQEGDRYLVAAAETIQSCCRAEDVIARWGGDEFVILLPKMDAEESQRVCDRIVERYSGQKGFAITPSIAIGCAVQENAKPDYQELLREAETNMYRHKLLESSSIRSAIVASLDNSLHERDYGTEEHAQAMVSLCSEVGRQLGLNASQCDELELLARLHDIGKIAISDTILMKPAPLTVEEWVSMKRHTEIGYRIAKSIPELEHVAEGILSHHERWDGAGYPRGLAGEAIPFSARIVAVIDSFDAMTRRRPYKGAIGSEAAMEELRRCSGAQFDPAVVDVFLRTLESTKEGNRDGNRDL